MSPGRVDMEETSRATFALEDGIERCLRAAAAMADMLNREMERASKQKRLQERGYEMAPGRDSRRKTTAKKSNSTSKSITLTMSEISDSIIFGRPKAKKKIPEKKKEANPTRKDVAIPAKTIHDSRAEKTAVPRSNYSLPAVLVGHPTPSISDVTRKARADHSSTQLKKKEQKQPKETTSSEDISIPSLPRSNTLSSYSRASPLDKMRCLSLEEMSLPRQGDEFLGNQDFPLFLFEGNVRRACVAQMEVHRRKDSDWLLLSMTLKGSRGDPLLQLRCELLGTATRHVVINGHLRPPFQKEAVL